MLRRLDDPFHDMPQAWQSGSLVRPGGHSISWKSTGAQDGIPVVVVHGGPGGASMPGLARLMDAKVWRSIFFDQRGCGASTPIGALQGNTLQATLEDMEILRLHHGIERWVVAGGSWGSTVALAYAETYPDRCMGLLLQGVWLCRRADIDWWFYGVRTLFPDLWETFSSAVPNEERKDLRQAYCQRILGKDRSVAADFATRLYLYEEGFMHFDPPLQPPDPSRGADYGRIFAHYVAHNFFLEENQLILNAKKISHLPAILVTGRYDCCTPPSNAYDLKSVLPLADLRIINGGGHYPTEQTMAIAVSVAAQDMAHILWQKGK